MVREILVIVRPEELEPAPLTVERWDKTFVGTCCSIAGPTRTWVENIGVSEGWARKSEPSYQGLEVYIKHPYVRRQLDCPTTAGVVPRSIINYAYAAYFHVHETNVTSADVRQSGLDAQSLICTQTSRITIFLQATTSYLLAPLALARA